MTFSIVARSADTKSFGVAVASKFLAVGAAVPAARAEVGAIATQAFANLSYRPNGLALLGEGFDASAVVERLVNGDERREERQCGVVDAAGRSATFTGRECKAWAGGRSGQGYAIQGNILAGPEVVDEMEDAWCRSDSDEPLARRLLVALRAGDVAGGDRRGRQSAALLVVTPGGGYGGGSDVFADLRVDDHESPVQELARLLELHDLYFGRPETALLLALDGPLLEEIGQLLERLGYRPGGDDLDSVRAALWDWAGTENLEERIVEGQMIDPVVLTCLRKAASSR